MSHHSAPALRTLFVRALWLVAVLGAAGTMRVDGQILLRSYTAEERYNHVRLPAEGAALTVWTAPVTLRLEEVAVRFVNERDSACAADIVVLASDGTWRPRHPRSDMHAPVRVWIAARADTTLRVRLATPPLVHAGEQFLAGAIVHSASLTVRMDRGLRESGGALDVTRSMFALPRADSPAWRIGSSYADGRRIGNWYIEVLARESLRASQVQLVRDEMGEDVRRRERLEAGQGDAPRAEAERAATPRAEAERAEAERIEANRIEAERLATRQRPSEQQDAERGSPDASTPVRVMPRVQPVPASDDDELSSVVLVHIAESAQVDVRVEDRRGRLVRLLRADTLGAGSYFFSWDGLKTDGSAAAPGWYDIVVLINGVEQARKSITRR